MAEPVVEDTIRHPPQSLFLFGPANLLAKSSSLPLLVTASFLPSPCVRPSALSRCGSLLLRRYGGVPLVLVRGDVSVLNLAVP